jgi:arginase
MNHKKCTMLGAPVGIGASQVGCQLGPDTLRVAGLTDMLTDLGYQVDDHGNLEISEIAEMHHSFNAKNLEFSVAWTRDIQDASYRAIAGGHFSIFLGGDHSISFGTISGMARYANEQGRPLFVLWIDAHTDFHSLGTSSSGNIHGMPLAYVNGDSSFEGFFPEMVQTVKSENICIMGIRSVDPAERQKISSAGITAHDMRKIDEIGVIKLLEEFLKKVNDANGLLHISLDADALDPDIAPAVGTIVPGGLTFREAHIMMEIIHDSNLATSLDLVELNPLLDQSGRTSRLLIDLTASLLGRSVLG